METSGTDMLSDSDNRATISPLHLAVSTAFTASLMGGLLKISHSFADSNWARGLWVLMMMVVELEL